MIKILGKSSSASWNRLLGILDRHLETTGAFAAGDSFTLADIVLGLSINRWLMTPMERPAYPALAAYCAPRPPARLCRLLR